MDLEKLISKVGKNYIQSSKESKIYVGQVIEGKIKLKYKRRKEKIYEL